MNPSPPSTCGFARRLLKNLMNLNEPRDLASLIEAFLQALADASLGEEEEVAEPKEETSFRSLLVELDAMEEGLKTDFDDLREEEAEAAVEEEGKVQP